MLILFEAPNTYKLREIPLILENSWVPWNVLTRCIRLIYRIKMYNDRLAVVETSLPWKLCKSAASLNRRKASSHGKALETCWNGRVLPAAGVGILLSYFACVTDVHIDNTYSWIASSVYVLCRLSCRDCTKILKYKR